MNRAGRYPIASQKIPTRARPQTQAMSPRTQNVIPTPTTASLIREAFETHDDLIVSAFHVQAALNSAWKSI